MSLFVNLVNTANEWALDKAVAGALRPAADVHAFDARYMLVPNLLTLALQVGVTARLVGRFGARSDLLALPLVSILGGLAFAFAFAFAPSLPLLRALQIVENATDYSVHTSTRELL
ncbi:MAG: hypothetical protein FJ095_10215 [Deltaproteobacteria bacterium]|nr:hypothetical protein [Deltaproteobacteria bacterium]